MAVRGRQVIVMAPAAVFALPAAAAPVPWGASLQPAATLVAGDIHHFGALTFWIVGAVTLLVMALLAVVIVRFNARVHPVPSRTTHNTPLEIAWTIVPVLILLAISIPSFRLLYEELTIPDAKMTVKATASKWFWTYDYPDAGGLSFGSYMLTADQITDPARQPRLLAVDAPLVVPVGEVIRLQITSTDVIHSFAMQPFGIKIDAIPGRLNESWFKAEATGTYYGQCSELCGQNHAFMPIEIRVLAPDRYEAWLAAAKVDIDKAKALLAAFDGEDRDGGRPAAATRLAAR